MDDEPEELALIATKLRHAKFETIFATSGEEALRLVEVHRPFVIISDLEMREMSGYELMEQVTENPRNRDIGLILFHSSWTVNEHPTPVVHELWSRPMTSGRTVDCHPTKPLHPLEVITFVKRIYDSLSTKKRSA